MYEQWLRLGWRALSNSPWAAFVCSVWSSLRRPFSVLFLSSSGPISWICSSKLWRAASAVAALIARPRRAMAILILLSGLRRGFSPRNKALVGLSSQFKRDGWRLTARRRQMRCWRIRYWVDSRHEVLSFAFHARELRLDRGWVIGPITRSRAEAAAPFCGE